MFDEPEDKSDHLYHVERIEKVTPPDNMPGAEWHRYVIGRGASKIVGMKPGSMYDVRQHADTVATALNERANKHITTYASRNKPKTGAS